jgi:hypothetical protein
VKDLVITAVDAGLKVFVPCVYGIWFWKLASDNFNGPQLLIFLPVFLLSLIGIWRVTLWVSTLFDRLIRG